MLAALVSDEGLLPHWCRLLDVSSLLVSNHFRAPPPTGEKSGGFEPEIFILRHSGTWWGWGKGHFSLGFEESGNPFVQKCCISVPIFPKIRLTALIPFVKGYMTLKHGCGHEDGEIKCNRMGLSKGPLRGGTVGCGWRKQGGDEAGGQAPGGGCDWGHLVSSI